MLDVQIVNETKTLIQIIQRSQVFLRYQLTAFCAVCVQLKLFHVNLRFQSQITQFVNCSEKKLFQVWVIFFSIIIVHIQ